MSNIINIKIKSFNKNSLQRDINDLIKNINKFTKSEVKLASLPTEKNKFTLLKSPHVNKKAREQFELTTYNKKIVVKNSKTELKKIIDILNNNRNRFSYDITFER